MVKVGGITTVFLCFFLHSDIFFEGLARHNFLKNCCYTTLYLLDLFGFWPIFGLFYYAKLPIYKRVKWGWLAGLSCMPYLVYLLHLSYFVKMANIYWLIGAKGSRQFDYNLIIIKIWQTASSQYIMVNFVI